MLLKKNVIIIKKIHTILIIYNYIQTKLIDEAFKSLLKSVIRNLNVKE